MSELVSRLREQLAFNDVFTDEQILEQTKGTLFRASIELDIAKSVLVKALALASLRARMSSIIHNVEMVRSYLYQQANSQKSVLTDTSYRLSPKERTKGNKAPETIGTIRIDVA